MTPKGFVPAGGTVIIHSETAPSWDTTISCLNYRRFTPEFVQRIQPEEVACWLFCAEYDALDIVRILVLAGFSGTLRTRSAPLPRPGIVRREILRECAGQTAGSGAGLRLIMETGRPHSGANHAYEAGVLYPGPVVAQDLLSRTA